MSGVEGFGQDPECESHQHRGGDCGLGSELTGEDLKSCPRRRPPGRGGGGVRREAEVEARTRLSRDHIFRRVSEVRNMAKTVTEVPDVSNRTLRFC